MRQPAAVDYMPGVNLLRSISLALRAINRSPKTQETYLDAARQFVTFLEAREMLSDEATKNRTLMAFVRSGSKST